MHRFLVSTETLNDAEPKLGREGERHLKVLRPRAGEEFELFDGKGRTRRCLWSGTSLAASGEIVEWTASARRLTLFACVTKGSRWDWTIEKAVELGVTRIVPVISDRTIVRIPASERLAKAERWRRVAEDAARQSDAVWLPEIVEAVDFPKALRLVGETGRVYVGALAEPAPKPILAVASEDLASGVRDVGVFVGPEGDFTPEELASLVDCAVPVTFGPTVLRAETAALFGVAALVAQIHALG